MKKIRNSIVKVATIIFTILFILIVLNTIFFNKTIQIQFFPVVLITGTIIGFGTIFLLYKTELFGLYNKISKIIRENKILTWIIVFALQLILINLINARSGWDCIILLDNSFKLYQGTDITGVYFSIYPNNLLSLIILKYLYVATGLFTNVTAENYYFIAIIFNTILVDLAAMLTIATCRKILGEKTTFLSCLFIIPLMLFFPNIIVPYTDTFSLFIPIGIFYLYLKIKDNTKMKFLYVLLEGFLIMGGYLLKPTCVIMGIAIVLVEIFYFNFKNMENKIIKIRNFIIMILILVVGITTTYSTYKYLENKNISKYITEEQFEKNSTPYTHFIMMGMQSYEMAGKPCYGAWNQFDVVNTQKILGQKAKKEYNKEIIKQRLNDFGFTGYVEFVYNKINWIASDGTFYYWQEGTQKYLPENQSRIAKHIQKFFNIETEEYQKVTANFLEVLWILILIGIVFSYKDRDKMSNILKTSIIGIILFIVIFEGRSRYLYNYISIFIIVGTMGVKNILQYLDKKILQIKTKKDKI